MEQGSWECRTRQIGLGRCMSNFWTRQDVKVGESPRQVWFLAISWSSTNFVVCFGWLTASAPKQLRCCYSTMKGQDARHPGGLCSEFILWWGLKHINICVTEIHWKHLGFMFCLTLQVEPTPTFGVSLVARVEIYDFVAVGPTLPENTSRSVASFDSRFIALKPSFSVLCIHAIIPQDITR